MSTTGDNLGTRMHEASVQPWIAQMEAQQIQWSLESWKRIMNAFVDYWETMPITDRWRYHVGNMDLIIDRNGFHLNMNGTTIEVIDGVIEMQKGNTHWKLENDKLTMDRNDTAWQMDGDQIVQTSELATATQKSDEFLWETSAFTTKQEDAKLSMNVSSSDFVMDGSQIDIKQGASDLNVKAAAVTSVSPKTELKSGPQSVKVTAASTIIAGAVGNVTVT